MAAQGHGESPINRGHGEPELTHLDERGHARMVDVGAKPVTRREAVARARLRLSREAACALAEGRLPKGDALPVARLAGIMAAKRTPQIIPLCHTVAIASVDVRVDVDVDEGFAEVTATVRASDRTGVEMEALVAASTGALALYDMVKAVERGAVIERVELLSKTGGQRGDWQRTER
ncbi:MAG: cyclic pyranopterin monophosphate synthase MoaC [Egibacteraceae bacterium]